MSTPVPPGLTPLSLTQRDSNVSFSLRLNPEYTTLVPDFRAFTSLGSTGTRARPPLPCRPRALGLISLTGPHPPCSIPNSASGTVTTLS